MISIKRHCPRPNHPAFVGRRCPKCESERNQTRGNSNSRGYDEEWKRFRINFLKKNPICNVVDCDELATDVDHIIALRDDFSLRLDETNCRALCHRHHSQRTGRDQVRHTARNK